MTSFDFESNKYHLMLASGVMNSEDIEASEPIFNPQTTFGITKEKINLKQSRVRSFIMSIYIRMLAKIHYSENQSIHIYVSVHTFLLRAP